MEINIFSDEYFMKAALAEAKKAFEDDEIPVGAVIVCKNQIIARAHNMTQKLNDVTAHAEMIAYTSASNYLNSKYLDGCTLFVTLEPCNMCAGASFWTQIDRIVFGARDEKRGYSQTSLTMTHPKTLISGGIMGDECGALLKEFFRKKRD
ncbi:MAG TPA: nucleoside deaminase [Bacteroidia bacterium]|nr:nucleoside deaminase [Bacteroidia bacterium]